MDNNHNVKMSTIFRISFKGFSYMFLWNEAYANMILIFIMLNWPQLSEFKIKKGIILICFYMERTYEYVNMKISELPIGNSVLIILY